ncbi:hypothetical protein EO087_06510 [Dyella sp. M7H15-1]|uniref:hypothetical protein n=1 Tax=Dyella sp. M7H15-1 TaxID=2501295 RepID=UPI001004D7DC|nr:hypothetical protein [Dyella sp. M7H15-1]QAU23679.1 hypothetical protein EO087_06510 [Dyella sp. M7H15-1]
MQRNTHEGQARHRGQVAGGLTNNEGRGMHESDRVDGGCVSVIDRGLPWVRRIEDVHSPAG